MTIESQWLVPVVKIYCRRTGRWCWTSWIIYTLAVVTIKVHKAKAKVEVDLDTNSTDK